MVSCNSRDNNISNAVSESDNQTSHNESDVEIGATEFNRDFEVKLYDSNTNSTTLGDFINLLHENGLNVYNLTNLPDSIIQNQAVKNFKINTKNDILFIKEENLVYRYKMRDSVNHAYQKMWTSKSKPILIKKEYIQYLIWSSAKTNMIYVDGFSNNLLEIMNLTPEEFKLKYKKFFRLIENWDKHEIYSNLNSGSSAHYESPQFITSVSFNNGRVSFDDFPIYNLTIS